MKPFRLIKGIVVACVMAKSVLALNVQAQVVTASWAPGTNPGLWSVPANWSTQLVPGTNNFANISSATPCVIDATAGTATCDRMNVADGTGTTGTLIVTNGGHFAPVYDYCAIAYAGTGLMDVESGCSVTFPSHLWIGFNSEATGTFIMNGGTVTVMQMFGEGWSGGTGHSYINAGTLNLKQWSPTQSIGPGSTLDIKRGTIIISGNYASSISAYVSAGQITAYGGTGTVLVDYNYSYPGDTTITAIPIAPSTGPRVIIPSLNTNEIVVAVATPQDFGAKGDGTTDDSAAFQNAMNWVYNGGNWGGGVIFVPAANYAFYTNLTIPQGVTLHGDWMDWTTGTNGLVGTTFKIMFGAGQTNGTPFISMSSICSLRDVNFWYPNQNPTNITAYPFTILVGSDCVVKNVVLVNSFQGIQVDGAHHIVSTAIGTPLSMGFATTGLIADVCLTEDIRFSPYVWPASGLSNAPAAGGSYAAWMRANGEGMQLLRVDGELSTDTQISGYDVGIEANSNTNGAPGATFYEGGVTNCGTALLAQQMPGQSGLQLTDFTLDGDTAVDKTTSSDATVGFDHCQIIGRLGTAVHSTGADWHSWMAFQNCTISNTLQLAGPGVFNVVDSSLSGATNCVMSANVTRAAFTGCTFSPKTNIVNSGSANNLLMDARQSISNALPIVHWTNALKDYVSRRPAKTNLYVATAWGATGNGSTDDTVAIQSALTAAGADGGGIVYLPGGKYHLTNTLTVPSGVELRGVREMRGANGSWTDGKSKASVLEPYGGQGTTNGPVALALSANSGVVGVNFNYETQNTNCIPFPATIQGRGANVYAIGVDCPNAFYYVDLDTYTCTNHLLYMLDGWILNTGFHVGNRSSGSIVDCQENPSYWYFNNDSSFQLGSGEGIVEAYAATNAQMNVLGNCTELMVKTFNIMENTYLHCVAESGYGPNVTAIGTYCDGTVQAYWLDAAAPCTINVVNSPMAVFSIVAPSLSSTTVGVISSTNFLGTARFFNSALFGGPEWDFVVAGGDVGFDLVHMLDHAFNGSSVSGGVLHLINTGAYITYNGSSNFPPYNVALGTNAGVAGQVSEIIGGYAYNGWTYTNLNTGNPVNVWQDYALNTYADLSRTNQYYETPPVSPELSAQYGSASQSLTLSWPSNAGAFYLFSTPALTPPVAWTLVTNPVAYSNGQWRVSLPLNAGGCEFYRLEQ
jgi:hypothetical protein